MVASTGKIGSPSLGVSYFEKYGYYAKGDEAHNRTRFTIVPVGCTNPYSERDDARRGTSQMAARRR